LPRRIEFGDGLRGRDIQRQHRRYCLHKLSGGRLLRGWQQ
jgi:hypothetical protein